MTLVDGYGPFAGAGLAEGRWRSFMRRMRGDLAGARSGVIRDVTNGMQVYDDNSGMQVKVRTGEVWIEGHWGEITADKTVPIAAAHATLARKDRIVAAAMFASGTIEVYAVTGTAAASPSLPSLTQDATKWEISLGYCDIPALDTSISGQTTDARHYLDLPHVTKASTSSLVVNNSTTLVNSQLTLPVSANRVYALTGLIVYTASTAADAKVALSLPSGASSRLAGTRLASVAAGTQGDLDAVAVANGLEYWMGGAGTSNTMAASLVGRVSTSDTAGTLTVQFAQVTADATDTTLLSGSWLKLVPIA